MEVNLEAVIAKLHLGLHDLVKEAVDARVEVLLVDHVKARDQIGQFVSLNDSIQLRLNVAPAEHFQSATDDSHAEERESGLNLLQAVLENCQFLGKWDGHTVVVDDTAENVAVFNDGDHLVDELTGHLVQDARKEGLIVVQLESEPELGLEVLPDLVILAAAWRRHKSHLVAKEFIKFLRVLPVLTKRVDFDESLLGAAFLGDVELVGFL